MSLMEITLKYFYLITEGLAVRLSTPIIIIFRVECVSFYNLFFHKQTDFIVQRN